MTSFRSENITEIKLFFLFSNGSPGLCFTTSFKQRYREFSRAPKGETIGHFDIRLYWGKVYGYAIISRQRDGVMVFEQGGCLGPAV